MRLDARPGPDPIDRVRSRGEARGHAPWAAAAAALLAIGLALHVTREPPAEGQADDSAPDRHGDRELVRRRGGDAPLRGARQSGRHAWKDILVRVYLDIDRKHIVSIAAGVTFYAILALFPAIAALVAVYGLFADPAVIGSHLDTLSDVMPGGGVEIVGGELKRLTSQPHGALGITFVIGLVTALWSANAGIKALFDALNLVHDVPEERGFIRLNAVSLAFTAATIGFAMLALAAIVIQPIMADYLGIATVANTAIRWLRWPVLLVVVMLWLAALYRFGPSRADSGWRWVTGGSAVAAILWLIASALFTWYAAHFGSYDKTYGSLGAIIGFMVWIWISTIVVLLGAEIDDEMARPARGATSAKA